jgi:hypothetical protein
VGGGRLDLKNAITIVLPLPLPNDASEEHIPLASKEIQEAVEAIRASRGGHYHLILQSADKANCCKIKVNLHESIFLVHGDAEFEIFPPAPFLLWSRRTVPEPGGSGGRSRTETRVELETGNIANE